MTDLQRAAKTFAAELFGHGRTGGPFGHLRLDVDSALNAFIAAMRAIERAADRAHQDARDKRATSAMRAVCNAAQLLADSYSESDSSCSDALDADIAIVRAFVGDQ